MTSLSLRRHDVRGDSAHTARGAFLEERFNTGRCRDRRCGALGLYDITTKPANERVQSAVQRLLKKKPSLQPMYDAAMSDGVLTTMEAKRIVEKLSD